MKSNLQLLNAHLELHNSITGIDLHQADSPPENPCLKLHIDQKPGKCSRNTVSLLQKGKHFKWATVGVVGDNLSKLAENFAKEAGYCEKEKEEESGCSQKLEVILKDLKKRDSS